MRCEQIAAYLPGFAGGDLRPETDDIVAAHLDTCASCSREIALQDRVLEGLVALRAREIEPPPYLAEEIIASAPVEGKMALPVGALGLGAVGRTIAEHREAIAGAAGTALVAAGALYAIYRAARKVQPSPEGDVAPA